VQKHSNADQKDRLPFGIEGECDAPSESVNRSCFMLGRRPERNYPRPGIDTFARGTQAMRVALAESGPAGSRSTPADQRRSSRALVPWLFTLWRGHAPRILRIPNAIALA
jgi:hypothetical protein